MTNVGFGKRKKNTKDVKMVDVTDEFIVGFMTMNKKSYKQKKVDARECLEEIFPGYQDETKRIPYCPKQNRPL